MSGWSENYVQGGACVVQGALLPELKSELKKQSRLPFPIVHLKKPLRRSDGSILKGTPTVLIRLSDEDPEIEGESIVVLEFHSWSHFKDQLLVSRARFPIVSVSELESIWEPEYLVTYLSATIVLTPKPSPNGDMSTMPGTILGLQKPTSNDTSRGSSGTARSSSGMTA